MRKYSKILLIGLVLIGAFLLITPSLSPEKVRNLFEMPPEIQKYQEEFNEACRKSDLGCKQYGSPKLVGDLDTGRMRPPQRRRVMHRSLDTIQENLDSFPSPDRKREAMENIASRMVILKDNIQ